MVSFENKMAKVDLATLDRELEDIMTTEYGVDKNGKIIDKIREENYCKDTSDPDDTVYRFFNLEKDVLLKFLKPYKKDFEYEVLDSKTGEHVEINRLKPNKPEPKFVLRVFIPYN